MAQVIIYKQDNGRGAVIYPSEEALAVYGIDAIAKKDVPAGKPYKIIDAALLPVDYSVPNAWTVNAADLTDGVGAVENTFPT